MNPEELLKLKTRLAPRALALWTIYCRPKDHPENFVLRRWDIFRGYTTPGPCTVHETLEAARVGLPMGLTRILPNPGDDPVIVESWI